MLRAGNDIVVRQLTCQVLLALWIHTARDDRGFT